MNVRWLLVPVVLVAVATAACGKSDVVDIIECGPNGSCPDGYSCDTKLNHCIVNVTGGIDARAADSGGGADSSTSGGADARAFDAGGGGGIDARSGGGIDAGVLDTMITDKPASPSKNITPSFSFVSIPAGLAFECSKDGGAFAACASPLSFTVEEGTHKLAVRAKDGSNVDPTPAEVTYVVDITGPRVIIISGPIDNGTWGPSGKFGYVTEMGEVGATYQCAFDSMRFDPCTEAGFDFGPLADGTVHTFRVLARDALGNEGQPVARKFTIDAMGPMVTITNPLNGGMAGSAVAATFTFEPEAGISFICQLDAQSVIEDCHSGHVFMMLPPGSHTVLVQATDLVGNHGPPATAIFTVVPASTVNILFPTQGGTTGAAGSVSYDVGDAVTLDCMLDSLPATCSTSGTFAFSGLHGGSHTFAISGTNQFGDHGPVDTVMWLVDVTGPSVDIQTPSDDLAGGTGFTCPDGTVDFQCVEDCPPDMFECNLDGGGFEDCSGGSYSFHGLSAGQHSIKVHAIDLFGNIGEDAQETWTVAKTRGCGFGGD